MPSVTPIRWTILWQRKSIVYYCICQTYSDINDVMTIDCVFYFIQKGLPNMNPFPDISCHVGDDSAVKQDKTFEFAISGRSCTGPSWSSLLDKSGWYPSKSSTCVWADVAAAKTECPEQSWYEAFWRWSSFIELNCGISDKDIRVYNALGSEVRVSV